MIDPLVLIPGLMADARVFLPQMVRLGASRAMQVVLPTQGETVEQMSESILAGLPPKFALLGHGLGGDVAFAQRIHIQAPRRGKAGDGVGIDLPAGSRQSSKNRFQIGGSREGSGFFRLAPKRC